MTTVVALEGLPFTGKTTSMAYARQHAPQWVAVSEYHDLVDAQTLAGLSQQPTTTADQHDRIRAYLDLDRDRWSAVQTAARQNEPVLLDRCHLSIIAYSIALHDCYGLGDPSTAIDRYRRAFDDVANPIGIPDTIVLLTVDPGIAVQRLRRLGHSIDPRFTSQKFVAALTAAYGSALTHYDRPVRTVDADLSLPEVHTRVLTILEEIS